MNTDYILENRKIREKNFQDKINARLVKCKDVISYADKQNTEYDRFNNEMLYGINNKMAAFGVSDGTCNQLDQLLVLKDHQCGAGAAGANPCYLEKFEGLHHDFKMTETIISAILFCILVLLLFNKN
jgi:hypothetical protein